MSLDAEVLVVDDDHDIRAVLIEVLGLEGYRTAEADNGLSALAYLRAGHRPRVILLDLMMPEMNGTEFCQELLRDPALASIPVVVLSADTTAPLRAVELKAHAGLRKPVDLDELLTVIGGCGN